MATAPQPAKNPLLAETERAQALAADPAASAWVSANAGAGKTHVLKLRVLRLLLAGTKPDRILCLTYTKAAAAEMAARVFSDLSKWATAKAERPCQRADQGPRARAIAAVRSSLRVSFSPARSRHSGGLKVQTIHAFCERLLQRFPLEAGVPPGFTILDDAIGEAIRREAIDAVLAEATRTSGSPLDQALRIAVAFRADDGFDEVLKSALGKREWLEQISRLALRGGDPFAEAELIYRQALGVGPNHHARRTRQRPFRSSSGGCAEAMRPRSWRRAARSTRTSPGHSPMPRPPAPHAHRRP